MALQQIFKINQIKLILSVMKLFSYLTFLLCCLQLSFASAGNLQGGGGGRKNRSVQRYLDKRIYALDGARREVVPSIMLINACVEGNEIHTIDPIWTCETTEKNTELYESSSAKSLSKSIKKQKCEKKQKKHIAREFQLFSNKCERYQSQLVNGQLRQICQSESLSEFMEFKFKYKMDVYQRSFGGRGTHLYPNKDDDQFVRTIDYNIPTCSELNIQ